MTSLPVLTTSPRLAALPVTIANVGLSYACAGNESLLTGMVRLGHVHCELGAGIKQGHVSVLLQRSSFSCQR